MPRIKYKTLLKYIGSELDESEILFQMQTIYPDP